VQNLDSGLDRGLDCGLDRGLWTGPWTGPWTGLWTVLGQLRLKVLGHNQDTEQWIWLYSKTYESTHKHTHT